ncbi:GNAT family N-acetyltransferase [Streptomyces aureus]|uniref:GNAT family N-acetyltransferase n=1 Tax=Streptomyces aureus TaxID=193461 RepID=UPI00340C740F
MYPVTRSNTSLDLRELTVTDVEAVHAVYGSPAATEHLGFEPRTLEQVGQIVARSIAAATTEPRGEYTLAVVHRDTRDLIGLGRLVLDLHQPGAATMGFALRPDVWGNGYGRDTAGLLLGVAFEDLGLHRVWGARDPLNLAAARTMEAAGMSEEGAIRGHVVEGGGWRDSVVHSILDHEWQFSDGRPPH